MAERATRAVSPARAGAADATLAAPRRCPTCGAEYPPDFLVCPKDKTSLEAHDGQSDDPLIGEVLAGSFMITGVLGSGGMGRVYEAEHVRLPKRYAVKVMHEQIAANSGASARFEREAQAAAKISSEHVLSVIDVVRAQGRTCIVTERLEGEELGDLLSRQRKLSLPVAISICRQVCRGLAAAHAVGVIHRDLKPENLFLVKREDGALHVKILDFGIAKIEDGSKLTQTGAVLGTPAYMAPEQVLSTGDVDARADIYAVGAVLYRMLTGSQPFPETDDPAVVLTRVVTEDPRRPRDLEKSIPPAVETLIQRAMARTREARPATMTELDRLLAAFDEPSGREGVEIVSSDQKPVMSGIALKDTVAVMPPPQPGREVDEVTKRARLARPAATMLTIVVSLTAGAAVFVGATLALRALTRRASPTDIETILLGVLTLLATLFVLLGAMRVLIARWRSAPAVERLGDGLRGALIWFFAGLGALTLAVFGAVIAGIPLPGEYARWVDAGVVLVPGALGAIVLISGLWRAWRL